MLDSLFKPLVIQFSMNANDAIASQSNQGVFESFFSPEGLGTSLAIALVTAFIALKVSKWERRKEYEYERSRQNATKRFDDEYAAIIGLSECLNTMIDYLRNGDALCMTPWSYEEARSDAIAILGKGGPLLLYTDLSTGEECCGVKVLYESEKGMLQNLSMLWRDKAQADSDSPANPDWGCCTSLYTRYMHLIEKCDELYCVSCRSCDSCELKLELAKNDYKEALTCGYCRLKAIEAGSRDRVRLNKNRARTPLPLRRYRDHYNYSIRIES